MRPLGRTPSPNSGRNQGEKEVLDLAAVLTHYGFGHLPDASSGWRKVRCEFHGERQASATVNFELGAYKCFACEFQGDTIKIIELAEKKEGRAGDFNSACRVYEGITGRAPAGVRGTTERFDRGAVASEQRSYEQGDGFLRSRLRRNPNEGRSSSSR